MGLIEILIILAIAAVIFIVIRRLPDTVGSSAPRMPSIAPKIRRKSGNRNALIAINNFFGAALEFFGGLSGRFKNRKAKITPNQAMHHDLKRPEDRDFWVEETQSKTTSDLIAHTYFEEAEVAFKEKDYRKAEPLYIEAVKENPRNVKAFNRLGAIYLEQQRFDEAIEVFLTAIKYDSSVSSRFYNLALAYVGQENYGEAAKNLKEALKISPENEKYKQVLEKIEKK